MAMTSCRYCASLAGGCPFSRNHRIHAGAGLPHCCNLLVLSNVRACYEGPAVDGLASVIEQIRTIQAPRFT